MKKGGILTALAAAFFICLTVLPARALTTNLRVGFCMGFAPYQSLDASGAAAGIHIDMLDFLAEQQSFSLEYIAYERNSDCYAALQNGEIDLVLGAPMDGASQYPFRQSSTLTTYTLCLIASDAVTAQIAHKGSASGHLGAIEQGNYQKVTSQLRSQDRNVFSNNIFIVADSQQEMVEWLVTGKAQFAVCEKESALHYLKSLAAYDGYTVAINYLFQDSSAILVRADDATLYRTINTGLAELRSSGTYSEILERWLVSDSMTLSKEAWRTILVLTAGVVLFILLYILLSTRLRKLLRRQVDQRTAELRQVNGVLSQNMARLERENEVRNSIVQNSSSAMFILDGEGRLVFLNQQAEAMSGLSSRSALGRHADSLTPLGALLRMSKAPPDLPARPELLSMALDGKAKIFRCSRYQLPDGQNLLFSAEDVTAEEQEKQAIFEMEKSRVLNTIVAGIAHEIKNPITAIQTYSALIPTQKGNEEFMASFSKVVPKETRRINALIESLIHYARPARGEVTTIDLAELITGCVELTASIAQKLGTSIQVRLERGLQIRGNRDHVRQALINYLMNALDAVEEKQQAEGKSPSDLICIFLRRAGRRIQVEVYDQGSGMDEGQRQQCMDPFFTTKAKGTGLGMAIATQRLRENGGEVWVESKKGCYTRVLIEFEECSI